MTAPSGDGGDDIDIYVSFFSPCVLTFYKSNSSSSASPSSHSDSFSCDGIVNSTNYEVIEVELSRVYGWPDICVANGPRCYDLKKYSDLSNFTYPNFSNFSNL